MRVCSPSGWIQLGRRLGQGGEGSVYLGEGATAIKLYTAPPSSERIAKLETLVTLENETLRRISAWPTALVRNDSGVITGFVMPRVENNVPLTQLTSPAERKRFAPDRHWDFLAHVSRNIAAAMQTIHDSGVVIADVNDLNIFISLENGRITFIDVDSFQVVRNGKVYPTGVGVPMYLAPELQGHHLDGLVRSVEHDRFALAVLIFQALMMGRHPFVGTGNIGTRELPDMIRDLPFAYGSDARSKGIQIPPAALPLSVLPAELATLFTSAFGRGARPIASEWVQPLERFKKSLQRCAQNAGHLFLPERGPCPWCEFEKVGIAMFYASSTEIAASFGASDAAAKNYQDWLDGIQLPSEELPINPDVLSPHADMKPSVASSFYIAWYAGWLVLGGAVLALFAVEISWLAIVILVIGGSALFGNGAAQRREKDRIERTTLVGQAEYDWNSARNLFVNLPISKTVKQNIAEARRLIYLVGNRKHEWERRLHVLESRKQQLQLDAYLDRHDIASANIRNLPRSVISTLASFGISTALDVARLSQIKVPGVGEARAGALQQWRYNLTQKFVYNPKQPLPTALVRAEEAKLAGEIAAAEHRLPNLRTTIDAGLRVWRTEREVKSVLLRESAEKLARARANLAVV